MSSASAFLHYLKPFETLEISPAAERWKSWTPGEAPLHPLELVSPHVTGTLKKGEVRGWAFAHPLVMLLKSENLPAIEAFWDPRPFSPDWPVLTPTLDKVDSLSHFGRWRVWEAAFACASLEPLLRLTQLVPLSLHPQHRDTGEWGKTWNPWEGFGQAQGLSDEVLAERLAWLLTTLRGSADQAAQHALLHQTLLGAAAMGLSERCLLLVERFSLTQTLQPAHELLSTGNVSGAWALIQKSPRFSLEGRFDAQDSVKSNAYLPDLAEEIARSLVNYQSFTQMAMAKRVPQADREVHATAFEQMGVWLLRTVLNGQWPERYGHRRVRISDPAFVQLLLAMGPDVFSVLNLKESRSAGEVLGQVLMERDSNRALLEQWIPHITTEAAEAAISYVSYHGSKNPAYEKISYSLKKSDQPRAACELVIEWLSPLRDVKGLDFLKAADGAAERLKLEGWESYRRLLREQALSSVLPDAKPRPNQPRF